MLTTFDEKQILRLKQLLSLLEPDVLTREQFLDSFKNVVNIVLKTEKELSDKNNKANALLNELFEELKENFESSANDKLLKTIQQIKTNAEKSQREQEAGMNLIKDKIKSIRDGKDADEKEIVKNVLFQIPKPELEAETLRDKLEKLKGDERIDVSAIKGLEKLKTEGKGVTIFGGSRPLQIQESGTVKEKVARFINFTGATVSRSSDGVVTVAVASNVETPTGTIDGANTTFTVLHTPKFLTLDGQTLYENYGYTLTGLTITTDIAPTTIIRSHY